MASRDATETHNMHGNGQNMNGNRPTDQTASGPLDTRGYPQDAPRVPHRDVIELNHARGLFEREALEVTLEGRILLMASLAARTREVCAGLLGHPRIREMSAEDRNALFDAVEDAGDLSMSLTSFSQALLEQPPTRQGRERQAAGRDPRPRSGKVNDGRPVGSNDARR